MQSKRREEALISYRQVCGQPRRKWKLKRPFSRDYNISEPEFQDLPRWNFPKVNLKRSTIVEIGISSELLESKRDSREEGIFLFPLFLPVREYCAVHPTIQRSQFRNVRATDVPDTSSYPSDDSKARIRNSEYESLPRRDRLHPPLDGNRPNLDRF